MAEMISKVSDRIKSAANATVKKTRSAANIAKYAVQIKSLNRDLKRLYEKLGVALYKQVKFDEDNDEMIASRIADIHEIQCEIDRLSEEIKKEKAELSRKEDEPVSAEFQVIDEEDMPIE